MLLGKIKTIPESTSKFTGQILVHISPIQQLFYMHITPKGKGSLYKNLVHSINFGSQRDLKFYLKCLAWRVLDGTREKLFPNVFNVSERRDWVCSNRFIASTLKEEIYGPVQEKGECRMGYNTELYQLYGLPDITEAIKAASLRWAGHIID
jgi:hypothetical protein